MTYSPLLISNRLSSQINHLLDLTLLRLRLALTLLRVMGGGAPD